MTGMRKAVNSHLLEYWAECTWMDLLWNGKRRGNGSILKAVGVLITNMHPAFIGLSWLPGLNKIWVNYTTHLATQAMCLNSFATKLITDQAHSRVVKLPWLQTHIANLLLWWIIPLQHPHPLPYPLSAHSGRFLQKRPISTIAKFIFGYGLGLCPSPDVILSVLRGAYEYSCTLICWSPNWTSQLSVHWIPTSLTVFFFYWV